MVKLLTKQVPLLLVTFSKTVIDKTQSSGDLTSPKNVAPTIPTSRFEINVSYRYKGLQEKYFITDNKVILKNQVCHLSSCNKHKNENIVAICQQNKPLSKSPQESFSLQHQAFQLLWLLWCSTLILPKLKLKYNHLMVF